MEEDRVATILKATKLCLGLPATRRCPYCPQRALSAQSSVSCTAIYETAALQVDCPLEEPASLTGSAAERHLWDPPSSLAPKRSPGVPWSRKGEQTEPGSGKYCFSSHKENCPQCNGIFNTASTKILTYLQFLWC